MQAITKNIEWQFSDKEVTAWGGMRMFKEFYDRTGIREELKQMALPMPGSNAGFDPVVVMESFWMSVWLGGSRLSHTAMVRFDDALKKIDLLLVKKRLRKATSAQKN